MERKSLAALGLVGGLLAATGAWNLYLRAKTESVPYRVVATVGDVELRRYPALVQVETTAPSQNAAFGRLFRYIGGANEPGTEGSMTTPVEIDEGGATIEMTAPVAVSPVGGRSADEGEGSPSTGADEEQGEGVSMAFFLPAEYDIDDAPRPTDDRVDLVAVPERTLAVSQFSWFPSEARVEREGEALLASLADN